MSEHKILSEAEVEVLVNKHLPVHNVEPETGFTVSAEECLTCRFLRTIRALREGLRDLVSECDWREFQYPVVNKARELLEGKP